MFSKKDPLRRLPRAVAFVDYEHWYISMDKMYHTKPDIRGWVEDMSKTMNVQDIYFFADFSKGSLREEIPKIRGFTNKIIETGNMSARVQKDFTDFIMLDHIYQQALSHLRDVDVFIIFTGDGHFYSVVSFLKNICKKQVGIYAVRGALSSQLRLTANWCIEYPNDYDKYKPYCQAIFTYLNNHASDRYAPTFLSTIDDVSRRTGKPLDEIRGAMQWLAESGYVVRSQENREGKTVTAVSAEWHSVVRDGLWVPERGAQMPRRVQRFVPQKESSLPQRAARKMLDQKTEKPAQKAAGKPTAPPQKQKKQRLPRPTEEEEVTELPMPTQTADSPKKRRPNAAKPVVGKALDVTGAASASETEKSSAKKPRRRRGNRKTVKQADANVAEPAFETEKK